MACGTSLFRLPPSASFVAGTVAKSFRFRCGCASSRYANTRLLVYKHTHHGLYASCLTTTKPSASIEIALEKSLPDYDLDEVEAAHSSTRGRSF